MPKRIRFADTDTLGEAKARVQANIDRGLRCPCCGRMAKRYARKINSGLARALILIYKVSQECCEDGAGWPWVKVVPALKALEENANELEYSKLYHWYFIEPRTGHSRGNDGFWRMTEDGVAFVTGAIQTARVAYVLDGVCVGFAEDDYTTIHRALGDHFDYDELMGITVVG